MGVAPLWLTAIVIGRDLAIILGVVLVVLLDLPVNVQPLFVGKISTALPDRLCCVRAGASVVWRCWPDALAYARRRDRGRDASFLDRLRTDSSDGDRGAPAQG